MRPGLHQSKRNSSMKNERNSHYNYEQYKAMIMDFMSRSIFRPDDVDKIESSLHDKSLYSINMVVRTKEKQKLHQILIHGQRGQTNSVCLWIHQPDSYQYFRPQPLPAGPQSRLPAVKSYRLATPSKPQPASSKHHLVYSSVFGFPFLTSLTCCSWWWMWWSPVEDTKQYSI